ncbi:type VI secretion system TssO [Phocaeicola vulgatus]|uniref:type VI secretion system TssO n=1 Tax=Phocaeicola vulgatus TaxID=821 RepID=UPI0034DABB12
MRENEQLSQNRATINQREKTIGFAYVLLLFLAVSICCCMIIFWTIQILTLPGKKIWYW